VQGSVNIRVSTAVAALALTALAGCASDGERAGSPDLFATPTWALLGGGNKPAEQPRGAADLVAADGSCTMSEPAAAGGEPGQSVAPTAGGVALEMSECEVVRRLGRPERVDVGSTERGVRTAVLTYLQGVRPGVYRFVDGRLTVLERAAEAPPAAKPRKPAKPQKPALRPSTG
jgi:hypothetical protein